MSVTNQRFLGWKYILLCIVICSPILWIINYLQTNDLDALNIRVDTSYNKTSNPTLLNVISFNNANISNRTCINHLIRLKLLFIHIPKTAGTSIVQLAWNKYHICYGVFLKYLIPNYRHSRIPYRMCKKYHFCGEGIRYQSIWHFPMRYIFEYMNDNTTTDDIKHSLSLYFDTNKYDYFCIVRHPFAKIMSEYKYSIATGRGQFLQIRKYGWIDRFRYPTLWVKYCSVDALNLWVKYFLMEANNNACIRDCHWLPQYEYVFDENGYKMCNNVIRFENIHTELNDVLNKYQMNGMLNLSALHAKWYRNCDNLSVDDLKNETKQLIYQFYKADFDAFKYSFNFDFN
eukprot:70823_1